jgi:hypothetical protein
LVSKWTQRRPQESDGIANTAEALNHLLVNEVRYWQGRRTPQLQLLP